MHLTSFHLTRLKWVSRRHIWVWEAEQSCSTEHSLPAFTKYGDGWRLLHENQNTDLRLNLKAHERLCKWDKYVCLQACRPKLTNHDNLSVWAFISLLNSYLCIYFHLSTGCNVLWFSGQIFPGFFRVKFVWIDLVTNDLMHEKETYVAFVSSTTYEPRHEISNNVVCATSKGSDQPAHTHSLIKAFASRFHILWVLSYWPNNIWSF